MRDFDFYQPGTLQEALGLLEQIPDARVVAGGTDLMVLMKDLLVRPSSLISLAQLEDLVGMDARTHGYTIGPMTRLWQLEHCDTLARRYPALRQAILHLAAPPIRNQATLGGNICLDTKCIYYNQSRVWERHLPHCIKAGGEICYVARAGRRCVSALTAETVGPLWLYDAELTLASRHGTRRVPLRAFYTGDGRAPHLVTRTEILTAVEMPTPASRYGVAYGRFGYRKALEFPQFNLSAAIRLDEGGKIACARVVAGAIGPAPVELKESVSSLVDQHPSKAPWHDAAQEAPMEAVRLTRSPRLTPFLQQALSACTLRVFEEALERALAY